MKIIATHDGRFHADEVLAIAILKKIYPSIKIIRTRNPKEYEKVDMLIDVGGKYNPEKGFFDHHQSDFREKRTNKTPYASAGLIWKHFGMEIVGKDKKAWKYIDYNLMQPIDRVDADSSFYAPEAVFLYTLDQMVASFRPLWNSHDQDWNKKFHESLSVVEKVLDNEITIAKSISEADKTIIQAIKEAEKENLEYIFIPHPNIPFMETCIKNPRIKYVIYPYIEGKWGSKAVTKNISTYETRKPFPESWRGLQGENLIRVTGIKDADFCHKAGFIATAKSRGGIVKMVEKSLRGK